MSTNRDSELTSIEDLEKRLALLRRNGVVGYKDGTLELAIEPERKTAETVDDLVARIQDLKAGGEQ